MSRRVWVPLRWGDLDAQGHVNNAAFADYLQEARADFFYGDAAESLIRQGMVVVGQQIEYLSPVNFESQPLAVDLAPSRVGAVKFSLAYRLWQGQREAARARTKLCPYDFTAGQPRRMTAVERTWLTDRVETVEPFRPIVNRPLTANARRDRVRVRWSDLDAYGHVNNVLFFNYIMEGRIAFTAAAVQSMNDSVDQGYLWFVVRQDVDYLAPMGFRLEPYIVRTGVAQLGRTSLTFCSEIVDALGGQVYARASTVAVFADAAGRPAPVRPEWKAALEPYRLP
ncbi:MAG: acyl-CoA thioesterase [Propionibacteriaceae bacterium]|jgi:acyl-CoA thioester hydrolase|nr:acyl-CoA thioesterase [Propionibacteriaceae bacterium]